MSFFYNFCSAVSHNFALNKIIMNKTIIPALLLSVILMSCNGSKPARTRQLAKADWLVGTWENKSPYGNLSESWLKENDSVYKGQSFFIKGKDTIHSEAIVLSELKGEVNYSPQVKGQNNDKPVDFKMTSATDKQLVFENPAHDFPQKITYTKITNDSLVAEISGKQQGKPASEQFGMKRK
jgi:hypothetical protein